MTRKLGIPANTVEGYLYPDTYRFPRGVTATTIAGTLVAQFRRVWAEEIALLYSMQTAA